MTRSINSNVGVYGTFGTASGGAYVRWPDNSVVQGIINDRVYAQVRQTDPYTYTVPITAADCSGYSISASVDTVIDNYYDHVKKMWLDEEKILEKSDWTVSPNIDPPLTQYAWPADVPTDVARIADIKIAIPIKKAHESKEEHMEVSEDLADFLNNL